MKVYKFGNGPYSIGYLLYDTTLATGVRLKDDGPTGQTTGQWGLWNLFGTANTLV